VLPTNVIIQFQNDAGETVGETEAQELILNSYDRPITHVRNSLSFEIRQINSSSGACIANTSLIHSRPVTRGARNVCSNPYRLTYRAADSPDAQCSQLMPPGGGGEAAL